MDIFLSNNVDIGLLILSLLLDKWIIHVAYDYRFY